MEINKIAKYFKLNFYFFVATVPTEAATTTSFAKSTTPLPHTTTPATTTQTTNIRTTTPGKSQAHHMSIL